MSVKYLKVKVKSLAEEARIIRHEEHAAKRQYRWAKDQQGAEAIYTEAHNTFWGLRQHRTYDVRNEARAAHIAYGYLRGLSYAVIETPDVPLNPKSQIFYRVLVLINKYGGKGLKDADLETWMNYEEQQRQAA